MNYATVCSGIGAPEEAWKELWGSPEFVSEIEAFPSAVLKHHYPDVPNHGDMTKYKEWPDHKLDILIGGTPCQAFSVAGLRRSLDDDRGNLTLTFLKLAGRYKPRFTIWENVPGVLNTPDNAFGQFLSGLAGYDTELHPTGGRWTNAGFIVGPERIVSWRVLDAQFFGVPQRRRRVFVIANPRDLGFASCQILLEPESLCGNTAPSRKEGEGVAADAGTSVKGGYWEGGEIHPPLTQATKSSGGVGMSDQELFRQKGAYLVMAHGQGNAEFKVRCGCEGGGKGYLGSKDKAFTVSTTHDQDIHQGSIVRRLTPVECEKLQGFLPEFTRIPWRNKPASDCPDGPRYKALGNSMAVPVIRWLGERMQLWEELQHRYTTPRGRLRD
jgi:DNA (cytosine-5)-methyltransferase 1